MWRADLAVDDRDYSDLPRDVLIDILIRTRSVKTIASSRCACKTWRDFLSGPYFAKLHFSTAPPPPCVLLAAPDFDHHRLWHFGLLESRNGEEAAFFSPSEAGSSYASSTDFSDISPGFTKLFMLHHKFSNTAAYYILGSCNGFLLWRSGNNKRQPLYISNPLTRECMALPRNSIYGSSRCNVLGFSPKTNQYKVIQLYGYRLNSPRRWAWRRGDKCWCALVHTIGTQTWRNIGNFPYPSPDTRNGVYLDGTVNWIANRFSGNSKFICTFDLETEQFRLLALLPTQCDDDRVELGLLGDCLCIVCHANCDGRLDAEIWVLLKNNSWIKKVVISTPISGEYRPYHGMSFLNILENGEILFKAVVVGWLNKKETYLVSYNPKHGNSKSVRIGIGVVKTMIIAHVPSFISLKDVVGGTGEDWRVIYARYKVSLGAKTREDAFYIGLK